MATSSLLLAGIGEAGGVALPGPGEEHDQQPDVDDAAGDDVEPDAGHRLGRRDPGLLHEAHVERHAADVRRRDPVDERRRQRDLDGGHERQVLADAADHADRRRRRT